HGVARRLRRQRPSALRRQGFSAARPRDSRVLKYPSAPPAHTDVWKERRMRARVLFATTVALGFMALATRPVEADGPCSGLPSHSALAGALATARAATNGGFNLDMWGTVVNRDGV